MRICRFAVDDRTRLGILSADGLSVLSVQDILPGLPMEIAGNLPRLIAHLLDDPQRLEPRGSGLPLKDVRLLAPIPHPPHNIICVGKNYREHAREFATSGFDASAKSPADAIPEVPIVFTKPSSAIIADGEDIPLHPGVTGQVDYEAELAVVIGRGGRAIPRGDALRHVWGYTIVNDVTARDLQARHRQWFLGKSLDGFCPMGPWIVTADEIDAGDLGIRCWVNGELRQNARTRDLIFDVPTLIATVSAGMTLEPGDVIATGTPAGVGIGCDPPRFLGDGDEIVIEIEGIGRLRNIARAAPAGRRSGPAAAREALAGAVTPAT